VRSRLVALAVGLQLVRLEIGVAVWLQLIALTVGLQLVGLEIRIPVWLQLITLAIWLQLVAIVTHLNSSFDRIRPRVSPSPLEH